MFACISFTRSWINLLWCWVRFGVLSYRALYPSVFCVPLQYNHFYSVGQHLNPYWLSLSIFLLFFLKAVWCLVLIVFEISTSRMTGIMVQMIKLLFYLIGMIDGCNPLDQGDLWGHHSQRIVSEKLTKQIYLCSPLEFHGHTLEVLGRISILS